jgi:hypothetical protein
MEGVYTKQFSTSEIENEIREMILRDRTVYSG